MPIVLTNAARAARDAALQDFADVASWRDLVQSGLSHGQIRAQLAAGRWTQHGNAIVMHSGTLSRREREAVGLISCGPRSLFTSFTSAQRWGLQGWEREQTHVLAPAGTARPQDETVRLHRSSDWSRVERIPGRRLHRLAPSLIVAASSFAQPRPACGILAAAVQQRLVTPNELNRALGLATRTRHRAALIHAIADIAQGADALSEIDFVRLCRRHGLPRPRLQAIRIEPTGRRRYLDVEWELCDGRIVAVEVDGAIHVKPQRWYDDQLRQNEVVIGGTILLRYPSVVVRSEEPLVVDQLRRILR